MPKNNREIFRQIVPLTVFLLLIGVLTWLYSVASFEKPPWGAFLTNFLYFLGLTQGVLVIAVVLRFIGARWGKVLYRLGGVMTLSFFPLALLMLLIIISSQGSLFYWAEEPTHNPWLISSFFNLRNILFFLLFYGLGWVLFKSSLVEKNPEEDEKLKARFARVGFFFLLVFVIHESIISWDLGMTLNPHWVNTVFAPLFWVGSVRSGLAALILIMAFLRRYFDVDFEPEHFRNLGHLSLALTIIWFYFMWSAFFPIWYANLPEETEALYLRIFGQGYTLIFGAMMFIAAIIPFFMLLFGRVRRSIPLLSVASILILIGLWLDRYLVAMPALVKEHKTVYTPILSFTNLAITLGMFGGFLLLFFLMLRRYPAALAVSGEAETEPSH